MKIFCYGIKEIERPIFDEINKDYNYDLTYTSELLKPSNVELAKGYDGVILFVNCQADAETLEKFKSYGVKYVVTRTAGFNHIDINKANELGYVIGRVPAYSPTAIASLAVSTGLSLLRKSSYISHQVANYNFNTDNRMFAKEIKNSTIGILGTGRIGLITAQMWHSLGAKIIGYDLYPNESAKEILTYRSFDEVIAESDLISVHVPYFPGQNDNFINKDVIAKMKKHTILVNCARGELVNLRDVIDAIKTDHLEGYATDVFPNEQLFIDQDFKDGFPEGETYDLMKELIDLYPRVLISPHLAYFTDEAVKNMAEVSFKNLKQIIETNSCDNEVKLL